jgi:hypothetical protein
MKENEPVCMHNARAMLASIQTPMGPNGQPQIGKIILIMGVDAFEQGVPNLQTLISSWYFPADDERCYEVFLDLLRNRKEMEIQNRAAHANITIPGLRSPTDLPGIDPRMMGGPGGRR